MDECDLASAFDSLTNESGNLTADLSSGDKNPAMDICEGIVLLAGLNGSALS